VIQPGLLATAAGTGSFASRPDAVMMHSGRLSNRKIENQIAAARVYEPRSSGVNLAFGPRNLCNIIAIALQLVPVVIRAGRLPQVPAMPRRAMTARFAAALTFASWHFQTNGHQAMR
jgi:hypothetical protein